MPLAVLAEDQQPRPPSAPERDLFGVALDSAGDVDRDGVTDLWVGDPSIFPRNDRTRGRAWCVSGKDGSTLLRIDSPANAREFGWTIAGLGDVDGDGVRDVAVSCLDVEPPGTESSPRWGPDTPPAGTSAVHVYSGRDGSLEFTAVGAADAVKEMWFSSAAGPALASVGDWNADGSDDFAIGWSYADGGAEDAGRVDVVSGRDGSTLHAWSGLEAYDRFGFSVARLPDLDGDGRAELAAGAVPDMDRSPTAPETKRRIRSGYVRILSSKGSVIRTHHPYDGSRSFGFSLATFPHGRPGGKGGLLIGQAHDPNARYAVTRWNLDDGSMAQLISKPTLAAWDGVSQRMEVSPKPTSVRESFGTRVMAVPDRDGDGMADILVTEPQAFCFMPAGVLSSKRGIGAEDTTVGFPVGRIVLGQRDVWYSHVGLAACAVGDVDSDGVEDLAISGASVRCGDCAGTVCLVSGRSLAILRIYVRANRE